MLVVMDVDRRDHRRVRTLTFRLLKGDSQCIPGTLACGPKGEPHRSDDVHECAGFRTLVIDNLDSLGKRLVLCSCRNTALCANLPPLKISRGPAAQEPAQGPSRSLSGGGVAGDPPSTCGLGRRGSKLIAKPHPERPRGPRLRLASVRYGWKADTKLQVGNNENSPNRHPGLDQGPTRFGSTVPIADPRQSACEPVRFL